MVGGFEMKSKKTLPPSRGNKLYKNQLQEYVKNNNLGSPVYNSIKTGSASCPKFITTVLVDGVTYTSPSASDNRKEAQNNAARIALETLSGKMQAEGVTISDKSHPLSDRVDGDALTDKIQLIASRASLPDNSLHSNPVGASETKTKSLLPSSGKKLFKNKLQEYTQENSLGSPVYHGVNCGSPSCPKFTATVFVNGVAYTSPSSFGTRKEAHNYVAKIALEKLSSKMQDEGVSITNKVEGHPLTDKVILLGASLPGASSHITVVGVSKMKSPDTFLLSRGKLCKNKLQEYTQKNGLGSPVYHSVNSGSPSCPKFTATVFVNGVTYTSPSTFCTSKLAHYDVARIALEKLSSKMKAEGVPNKVEGHPLTDEVAGHSLTGKVEGDPILNKVEGHLSTDKVEGHPLMDKIRCHPSKDEVKGPMTDKAAGYPLTDKDIVHELSTNFKVALPHYITIQTQFKPCDGYVVYVEFKGIQYKGEQCETKNLAEQAAARAVILSLSEGGNSEEKTFISKMTEARSKVQSRNSNFQKKIGKARGPENTNRVNGGDMVAKRCDSMNSGGKKQLADGGAVDIMLTCANNDPSSAHASVDVSQSRKRAAPDPDTSQYVSLPPANEDCSLPSSMPGDNGVPLTKRRKVKKKKPSISVPETGRGSCQPC